MQIEEMVSLAFLLVLSSGFLHSVWNLYTKRSLNKNVFLWFCQLAAILIFLPWAVMDITATSVSSTGYPFILLSMLLHGLYVILLAATYTVGDLSQVYPIMRGTSPLLVPLVAVLFLEEKLTYFGWIGVVLIVIGIVCLSDIKVKGNDLKSLKAPMLALAVGICIASYITVDKISLTYVSPVVLNEASNIGNLIALTWATFASKSLQREIRTNWRIILLGGLIAPGGYLLFLYALSLAPVSQLAPMREIGTVFGTILGVVILREKQGVRRILTSMLITAGVITLGIWG
jgi:drug/metabolite transporter (DMT)-like permease